MLIISYFYRKLLKLCDLPNNLRYKICRFFYFVSQTLWQTAYTRFFAIYSINILKFCITNPPACLLRSSLCDTPSQYSHVLYHKSSSKPYILDFLRYPTEIKNFYYFITKQKPEAFRLWHIGMLFTCVSVCKTISYFIHVTWLIQVVDKKRNDTN